MSTMHFSDFPKVSVVVPMYNAESTVTRCIKSLLFQSYPNIEIVLIDNNSNDRTYEICASLCEENTKIKLYKCKKKGVSSARNRGLEEVSGKFITFVDSDDFLSKDAIKNMVAHADDGSMSKVSTQIVQEDAVIINSNKKAIFSREEYIEAVLCNKVHGSVCGALLESKWVETIRFDENIGYMEDFLFLLQYLKHTVRIAIVEGSYYYVQQSDSITQSSEGMVSKILEMSEALDKMEKYAEEYLPEQNVHRLIANKKAISIEWKLSQIKNLKEMKEILREERLQLIWSSLLREHLKIPYFIYFYILRRGNAVFLFLYIIIRRKVRNIKNGIRKLIYGGESI